MKPSIEQYLKKSIFVEIDYYENWNGFYCKIIFYHRRKRKFQLECSQQYCFSKVLGEKGTSDSCESIDKFDVERMQNRHEIII